MDQPGNNHLLLRASQSAPPAVNGQHAAADRMRELLARTVHDHIVEERSVASALQEIRLRLDAMDGTSVTAVAATLDGLAATLGTLDSKLIARIERLDERLADTDDKLGSVDARLTSADDKLGALDTRLAAADGKLGSTDARVAALKAGLELTPDQAKNWPAFEQAYRDIAQLRGDRFMARRDQTSQSSDRSVADGLQRRADSVTRYGAALEDLAKAAKPLYQSLDDAQKHRFIMLAQLAGRHGHLATSRGHDGAVGFNASPGRNFGEQLH